MILLFCCKIQIMTTIFKQSDDLASKLKIKKTELMRQENQVKDQIVLYYNQLRQVIEKCEQQTNASLDSAMLSYYQKSADIIKNITKGSIDNQQLFEFAKEFLNYKINGSPIIDCQKIATILNKAYQITINNKPQPKMNEVLKDIFEGSQAGTQTQDMSEIVIQKLQCERDYYQRRETELQQKIKQMEVGFNKRGINIKQMSRTHLEEKCSKWAFERLTEQKKILVQRISEASQQIMRLNRDIGQLQQEIKKITGTHYDAVSKSIVGNSSFKGASLVDETRNYEQILEPQETRRQRQAELFQKNQQLMLELTRCMKQMQDITQANSILEQRIENDQQKITEMKHIIQSLKQSNECLNHDYEISLKRKAAFEQQCRQLKADLSKANQTLSEDRETYTNLMNQLQNSKQQVLVRVKEIQDSRRYEVEKYQSKLKEVLEQKQKLRIVFQENFNKKDEEANYKALLNDQISRLLKQTAALSRQLQLKEHKLFEQSENSRKMAADLQASEARLEHAKKENSKLKKQAKQQERQMSQLQHKIQHYQSLEVKIAFLEQNYHLLLTEFTKYKESSQKKAYISEKTLAYLKEKFTLQLTALTHQEAKGKNNKKTAKVEIIEKYIEQMITLSSKTAQIKQMKDQIRELKEAKQHKSIKKSRANSIEQNVSSLQGGVINLGAKIMEERIKSQKQLFEQQIKSLQEVISKEQIISASLQEELQRERAALNDLKKTQKLQVANEDKSKNLKQKDQKIDRLQAELKISRANCRRLQNQNTQLDLQLKIKKQLAIGLKKECKEKDDMIKQISTELSATQEELEKAKRNQKEANKKQTMFRDIKQKKEQVDEENTFLKKNIQALQDKIKLLHKHLAKKEECLKEVRNIEEKQIKVKEEAKLREAYETIANQKEIIRKLKAEIDRKDEIIKNSREKGENKVKELQTRALSKEKQSQKAKRQLELYERKIETAKNNFKREQNRNYLLTVFIKKLFQLCLSSSEQQQRTSNNKESIHYYSATTVTPSQIKPNNKSASNFQRNSDICEGLRILDLKPEDLEGLLGETTIASKVSHINHETSWSMVSPIVCKSNEILKQDQLLSGLEELQKLLTQKELNNTALLELFKRAMRAY